MLLGTAFMGRGNGEGMLILFSKYLYSVYPTQGLFLFLPIYPSALDQSQPTSQHYPASSNPFSTVWLEGASRSKISPYHFPAWHCGCVAPSCTQSVAPCCPQDSLQTPRPLSILRPTEFLSILLRNFLSPLGLPMHCFLQQTSSSLHLLDSCLCLRINVS